MPAQVELQVVPLQSLAGGADVRAAPAVGRVGRHTGAVALELAARARARLFWQVFPPLQGMPQAPQLLESVAVFTHSVPQAV